jgi:drug/metabolite transporter (DMT)-like permease
MNTWLFYALLAPLLWSLTNVFDSILRRHYLKDDSIFMWLSSVSRLPFVPVFFVLGGLEIPAGNAVLWLMVGGVLWTLPFVLYYRAMKTEEPSRIALMIQLVPLFTLVIARFVLHERLTSDQGIAFALLIIGGVFAALKKTHQKWVLSGSFFLLTAAAFFWAWSDVIFKKFSASFESFMGAFAIYFFGSFLVSVFMMRDGKHRRKVFHVFEVLPVRAWWILVATQTAGVAGSISFAYALTLGKASLTSVMLGIQPLLALLLGLALAPFVRGTYHEDITTRSLIYKGASFVLMLTGLMLLEI